MTIGPKKKKKTQDQKCCFVPNIWSNLHLVNFNLLIEKVKKINITDKHEVVIGKLNFTIVY